MAINKKLIHFKKKETFDRELSAGNILDTSIVFIQDAKMIWTHGTLYPCPFTIEELKEFVKNNTIYQTDLPDDLVMPNTVGGIKANTKVSDLEGDSFSQMFDNLLFPEIQPTIQNPSSGISFKNSFSSGGIYEVGATSPTVENLNGTFNRGTCTVVGQSNKYRAGGLDNENSWFYYGGTVTNKTFPEKITLGTMSYYYHASYSEGDVLVTSKGNKANVSPNPLTAGSVNSGALSIYGTYPYYCNGASGSTSSQETSFPTSVSPNTKLPLKKWTDTLIGVKFASEATTGTRLYFEYPSSKTISKVEFFNTVSGKWEVFGTDKYIVSSSGNKTIQGNQIAYSKLTTQGALSGALQLRFTVSNTVKTLSDEPYTYEGEEITDEVINYIKKNSDINPFEAIDKVNYDISLLASDTDRATGVASFAVNFEPGGQSPLDARTLVPTKSSLINTESYKNKNYYKGMMVIVEDTQEIYILKDISKISSTDYSGWKRVDVGAQTVTEIINNLTSTSTSAALSANMGKHLQDTKLNKSDVINNLTTTDSSKALSASQGKVLNDKILAIGNAYRVKGSKTNLSEVLSITNAKVGDVWNITTEFTLHGKPFPASTNLVCITDTSESDHDEDNWDPLGGTVDLTPYATKSEVSNTYATKSEVAETYATKEEVEENEKVTAESLVDLNSKLEDNETKIDTHISNKSNPHSVTKAQIGLGNVDNTSDANKPISNATKTELDKKIQTVSITGSGNAITNATISGTTLTLSKEATYNNYTLPKSTTTALGGIMIGYAENGKNYPIELDSSGKAFVNIPWTDTKTTVDSSLSSTSTNPVQNKVIYTALSGKANTSHTHTKSNITDLNTSLSNDTDLNNIKEVGWYYSIDSNTISNKPSDITAFGLEVIRSANGCYSQTCYSSNSNKIYYRYYNGTSWGSWNKIYTAGDKPTAAEIGAASSNHTHNYAGSSSPGGTATSAAKVNNSLILKIASGTTEGTDIYTFNGSTGKTLDIKAGSNITLTPAANSLTISSKDTIYTHPTNSGNKHIPSGGSSGQILRWGSDGTAVWGNDNNTTYSQATSSTLGLVKIGFTASGKSYPVELNSSGQMYVNVPWTDNNTQYSVASNTSLGLVKIGYSENGKNYPVELDSENKMYVNVPWVDTNTTYSVVTQSANGLMSSTDKKKLDGIETGAQVNKVNSVAGKTGDVTLSKNDVGLGNVTNESKATMFTNAALTGTPTAPTAGSGTNSTQIATTAFVQTEINNKIAASDAMIYKGTIGSTGATITSLPASHKTGWTYKVITAGTYAGQKCEIGDMIICLTDGSTATDSHWTVVQANIDGVVTGPSSAVDKRVAIFNGTTGKLIADSGFTIGKSVPSNAVFTDTTYNVATSSSNGLMSSSDKAKLDGITASADPNQNAFSNITIGSTTISADNPTDTLTIVAGSNITLTPDNTNDKITIAAKDTTYGAASSSTLGLVKTGSNITNSSGTISITKENVTSALGYTPPTTDTNTHYTTHLYAGTGSAANASTTNGNTKLTVTDDSTVRSTITLKGSGGTSVTSDASGNVTVNSPSVTLGTLGITATAAELNYCDGVTSNIQTQLNGKSATNHNHNSSYVSALGTSGNYVTWTKNGTTNNITVPYSSNSDKLEGLKRWYSINFNNKPCLRIITLTVSATHINIPITFDIQGRSSNAKSSISISFNSENNTDPTIQNVYYIGDAKYGRNIRVYKSGTGIWEVWLKQQEEGYDSVVISNISYKSSNIKFEITESSADALPSYSTYKDSSLFVLDNNISGTAANANKTTNSLVLKFNSGTSEGNNLYTFNGSSGKTIDIKSGSNVSLSTSGNTVTISSTNTTYGLASTSSNGLLRQLNGNTSQFMRGDGNWGTPINTTYSQATSSTLGLVKIGFPESGQNYPVELNSSGQMFVNVPWTDTNTVPQFQIYAGTTDITNNTNAAGFSGTPKLKLNTDSNEQHAILFQGGAGVNVTIGGDGTNKYIQAGINSSTFKSSIVPTIFTGAISGLIDTNLTSSRALISNTSGKISASSVTSTQLGYLNGVTSSIQTQLNTIKSNCIYRGVCSTSAGTAAKTVSVDGDFTLTAGVFVAIRFEQMNAASNPTLNVNNTGAKAIFYRGAAWKTSQDPARQYDTILMTYDGTQWMISALLEPNKVNFSNASSTLRAKNFNLDTSTSSNGTITRTSGIQDLYFDSDILSTTSGLFPHSSNANACITVKTNSGNYYHQIGLSSNKKMYARSFQNVVPNSTTSWYTIPYCEDSQDWTGYQDFQSGAGNTGSDMRFKEKKNEEIDNILPDLMNLKVFEYIWRKEGEREKDTFGVSANQLLEFGGVFEKIVHEREDKEKTKWVEYDRIGVLTLKGLQETNKKLEEKCKKYESALKILGEKLGIDLNDLLDNNED